MGLGIDEIDEAVSKMTPPYDMNTAVQYIHESKQKSENRLEEGKFEPKVGMEVRKLIHGHVFYGFVTSGPYKNIHPVTKKQTTLWDVTLTFENENDTKEQWDWEELLDNRASRPLHPHPATGRSMCFLELFSGCGIVTQKFADRDWRVKSIDNAVHSSAIHLVDIMNLNYDEHLGMLPDCIWASPPCFTYSNLTGKYISSSGLGGKTSDKPPDVDFLLAFRR
jgi:hypothetical protein